MLNLSFPCTTKAGGTDPGKPCDFPFALGLDHASEICEYLETVSKACYTRVTVNNSVYYMDGHKDFWGYCSDSCNGETPGPDSKYNLVNMRCH